MGRHLPRIAHVVYEEPWVILPSKLDAIVAFLDRIEAGGIRPPEFVAAGKPGPTSVSGGVAVIPVMGTLAQHGGLFDDISGGCSCDSISGQLRAAADNPSVGSIVLNIDSPGGSVFGVQELAALIKTTCATKPVIAVANAMAASGAYWLASQCTEIVVTPSGQVGSIGVLTMHTDLSRAADANGVSVSYISAGRYKIEGNPYQPLADDARNAIQAMVDGYYRDFVNAVADGRNTTADAVRNGMGEARVVNARDAVKLNMADRIATLDETLARLTSGRARVGRATVDASVAAELGSGDEVDADALDRVMRMRRRRLAISQ